MTTKSANEAFARAPTVEMSTWYKGILISSLATEQDTGGAFELVEAKMRKGTEPPPHVHEREDELFYVLDGVLDAYVGDACLHATAGSCVFLPKGRPHAFKIQSEQIHMLTFMTPGGFMGASASMAIPARSLAIPPEDGVTYATVDLSETIKVFQSYGVRMLGPDEIARELPALSVVIS